MHSQFYAYPENERLLMQRPLTGHFDNIAAQIRQELRKANYSVKLAIAWLTEQSLLAELAAAARRGVQVEMVVSRSDFNSFDTLTELTMADVEVVFFGPESTGGRNFLHYKFCFIDCRTLITGSFNWSKNAGSNEENIVISRDNESVAAASGLYAATQKGSPSGATGAVSDLVSGAAPKGAPDGASDPASEGTRGRVHGRRNRANCSHAAHD